MQEQIATTLLEEKAFDAALPRFDKLAQSVKDRGRQLAFRMEAADIRVRLGQTEAALNEFESLLRQLNPDHGIYREVRRRIEAIYLRTEDRAGPATYYEAWLVKHPDDLDAIMRVAQTYAAFGRDESASTWLERGVKLAPSRKERRRALIDRLLEARQVSEALAHCEQFDRDEPNNSDTLRDWGRAILKDSSRDGTARRQAAAAVWRKRSEARPKNALVASQVGDSLRQAEMIDEAVDQYRRAITLAPEATQYREYLGEYFHSLKRSDDALATHRRGRSTHGRLAEVLAGFGYVEEAITNYADACRDCDRNTDATRRSNGKDADDPEDDFAGANSRAYECGPVTAHSCNQHAGLGVALPVPRRASTRRLRGDPRISVPITVTQVLSGAP